MTVFTSSQKDAIYGNNNVFIEAGAGSGKTTVFVERFLTILRDNPELEPKHILAITFTRLAANELVDRIRQKVTCLEDSDPFKKKVLSGLPSAKISTIHGFCHTVLRQYPLEANIDPHFQLMEPNYATFYLKHSVDRTLEELFQTNHTSLVALRRVFSLSQIHGFIMQALSQKSLIETLDIHEDSLEEAVCSIACLCQKTYETFKKKRSFLDNDDLIDKTADVLLNLHCLRQIQKEIRYVFVDEFQDTDPKQWEIMQLLCDSTHYLDKKKLFLVGDVKQSIYGFRGVHVQQFLTIKDAFLSHNASKVVYLSDNFRTQASVLNALNPMFKTLFESDTDTRIPYTPLTGFKKEEGHVSCAYLGKGCSHHDEARFIAEWILQKKQSEASFSWSDVAVLFRRRRHFSTIKKVFDDYQIPIQWDRSTGYFQLEIVQDLYQLTVACMDPLDPLCWIRLLTSPLCGLSLNHVFALRIVSPNRSLWEAIIECDTTMRAEYMNAGVSEEECQRLFSVAAACRGWGRIAQEKSVSQALQHILVQSRAWQVYRQSEEGHLSDQALRCFIRLISSLEAEAGGQRDHVVMQLGHMMTDSESPPGFEETIQTEGVCVFTIHSSKGLEFPYVIIPECDQKFYVPTSDTFLITKHGLSLKQPDDSDDCRRVLLDALKKDAVEESKRLFYVACTRSEKELVFVGKDEKKSIESPSQSRTFFDFLSFLDPSSDVQILSSLGHFSDVHKQGTLFFSEKETREKTTEPVRFNTTKPILLDAQTQYLSMTAMERFLYCSKQYRLSELVSRLSLPVAHDHIAYGPYIGTCIHQAIYYLNMYPETTIEACLSKLNIDVKPNELDFIFEQLQLFRNHPLFERTSSSRMHEFPFTVSVGRFVIEGRFDSIYRDSEGWVIVDYKTDAIDAADIDRYVRHYSLQLKLYALAIRIQYQVKETIRGSVYFTQLNTYKTVSFSEAVLKELETNISSLSHPLSSYPFTPPDKDVCRMCPYYYIRHDCPDSE